MNKSLLLTPSKPNINKSLKLYELDNRQNPPLLVFDMPSTQIANTANTHSRLSIPFVQPMSLKKSHLTTRSKTKNKKLNEQKAIESLVFTSV